MQKCLAQFANDVPFPGELCLVLYHFQVINPQTHRQTVANTRFGQNKYACTDVIYCSLLR